MKKYGLLGIVVVLGVSVVIALGFSHHASPTVSPRSSHGPTPDTAAESTVPATYAWQGAADEPKYITLPSIQSAGFVQQVHLQNQQIAAPNNINMAGWYTQSAKPGQPGLSVIDGHVDGATQPGVFKNLGKVKTGDAFTVQLGSGTMLRYAVMSSVTVSAADALNYLFSQDPRTPSQLNLITCDGTFNTQVRQYDKRVIVMAKLQP